MILMMIVLIVMMVQGFAQQTSGITLNYNKLPELPGRA